MIDGAHREGATRGGVGLVPEKNIVTEARVL